MFSCSQQDQLYGTPPDLALAATRRFERLNCMVMLELDTGSTYIDTPVEIGIPVALLDIIAREYIRVRD